MKKYSEYPDEQLVNELAKGDTHAFHELYNRYHALLYAFAYKLTADTTQSEDILQDIFVSLWDGKDRLKINQSVSAYLYKAVRYQFFRSVAQNKLRKDLFNQLVYAVNSLTASPDEAVCYKDLQSLVEALARQLPGNTGNIFIKSRLFQMTNREIAEELGISEKTVRNQLSLANRQMRAKLGESAFVLSVFLEFLHNR